MSVTSANRYLSRKEMEGNALYIASALREYGFTDQSISALLGNMESESGINPGIYESLDDSSDTNGFGLVQWTPNTKYKTWADEYGYSYGDIDGQLHRIQYELENGLQWIPTDTYPLSFTVFKYSKQSPEYLAQAFLYNYERPKSLDQPNRSVQARAWYDFITGNEPGTDDPPPIEPIKNKPMSKLLFYYAGMKGRI